MKNKTKSLLHSIVFPAFFLLLLLSYPELVRARLTVISPLDNSLYNEEFIKVIGSEDTADKREINISVKGRDDSYSDTADIEERVFLLEIRLFEGKNEIRVGNIYIDVFYNDGTIETPENYRKTFYHRDIDGILKCTACHNTEEAGLPLTAQGEKLCARCHTSPLLEKKIIHEPAAECSNKCHDPHAAKNRYLLKYEGNTLCINCHELPASHHALKFESKDENVIIGKDFMRDGENFACSGCHDSHGSGREKLLHVSCDACHKKK